MGLSQIKVELLSSWHGGVDGDHAIAHAAWASSTDIDKLSTRTDEDVRRVVTQIVDKAHGTPKERVWMEYFITAPIFVERQIDKYRLTYQASDFQVEFFERPMGALNITQNELSGRYRTLPERLYTLRDTDIPAIESKIDAPMAGWFDDVCKHMMHLYQRQMADAKAAKAAGRITDAEYKRYRETIRSILPVGTLTDFRLVMNLRAFEHIISERLAPDAQLESRAVAYLMLEAARNKGVASVAIEAMMIKNGWSDYYLEVGEIVHGTKHG